MPAAATEAHARQRRAVHGCASLCQRVLAAGLSPPPRTHRRLWKRHGRRAVIEIRGVARTRRGTRRSCARCLRLLAERRRVRHSHALRLIWLASFVAAFSPTVRPDRLAAGAAARRRLRVSQNRLAPDVNMRPSRPSGGAKSSTVEWASQKNRILQSTFYSQTIHLHSSAELAWFASVLCHEFGGCSRVDRHGLRQHPTIPAASQRAVSRLLLSLIHI